jgi:hypothetical protein
MGWNKNRVENKMIYLKKKKNTKIWNSAGCCRRHNPNWFLISRYRDAHSGGQWWMTPAGCCRVIFDWHAARQCTSNNCCTWFTTYRIWFVKQKSVTFHPIYVHPQNQKKKKKEEEMLSIFFRAIAAGHHEPQLCV